MYKKRTFNLECNAIINVDVKKLLDAKFIREVSYPKWCANVVLVKKAKGKWRV